MRAHLPVWLVCLAVAVSAGCRVTREFLPRTHTTSVAPDGKTRAFVRQHLNPDPPDDHLYIARPGEAPREVMALAPDADWSRDIAWSPDSRKVGFVINGHRLAVYDARSFELEAMLILAADEAQEVRSVSLARPDAVSFDVIERALLEVPRDGVPFQVRAISHVEYRPGTRMVAPERSLGRQTVPIPARRLSLRIGSADRRPAATTGWARLQARDGRQVRVPWTRTDDNTARLPAFDAGPLEILEVGVPGRWRTAVLKDVEVADGHVAVTLPIE